MRRAKIATSSHVTRLRGGAVVVWTARRPRAGPGSELRVARDVPLQPFPGDLVRPLLWRGLHEIRGGCRQRTAVASVHREFADAHRVDDDARRVGRPPNRRYTILTCWTPRRCSEWIHPVG